MSRNNAISGLVLLLVYGSAHAAEPPTGTDLFQKQVAPLLTQRCLSCHNSATTKGDLDLSTLKTARAGGSNGPALVPSKPEESNLLERIRKGQMPPKNKGEKLTADEIAILERWIKAGAAWPESVVLSEKKNAADWWSLKPPVRPAIPNLSPADAAWVRTPVDAFIIAKLREKGLTPSPEADRRTLVRRICYDLHGMPPTPEEIDAALSDKSPDWYEKLVDRLLASPRYGERWGRHWLDAVHYGDTHGYDKDKIRPNAWPYRDYVIRALNDDKPYAQFIKEQLAGDVFAPGTRDGIAALGFIAAGPWDFVGQVELAEGTLDKKITRNLDRDDMVATTVNTFCSLTAQCARCHDHKFDPILQEDYYSLQAVFAAVDRADRPYENDSTIARNRADLLARRLRLSATKRDLTTKLQTKAGPQLAALDRRLDDLQKSAEGPERPEFGYHSAIETAQDRVKWVQVDLGKPTPISSIAFVACHDIFANIGPGFGFPVRFKIEVSDNPSFKTSTMVLDCSKDDVPNPGMRPQSVTVGGKTARYIRFTATKLALRSGDHIFALAELCAFTPDGTNAAAGKPVTAFDSIEAPVRWRKSNLVDGYFYRSKGIAHLPEVARLQGERAAIVEKSVTPAERQVLADAESAILKTEKELGALPPPGLVFAASSDFAPSGSFRATGGKPRPVYLLKRGSEKTPGPEVGPGAVAGVPGLEARFKLPPDHPESERRAALARWITDPKNPLTWRSIVNRVWQYHFGRGIVETPNDFGRMGSLPTHPELLDWLASEFTQASLPRERGEGGWSVKDLHRLLVTSAVYRQASTHNDAHAKIDGGNQYLWRMNRQRLESEAIRDTIVLVSGKLDTRMFGPGFKPFGFIDDHSPHYKYEEHNPDDPASHRRSIYRFIVRSVPDPFMETLDCADPSQVVARRNETLTALQALALLNNRFMVRMAEHFAARAEKMAGDLPGRVTAAYRLALERVPTAEELELLTAYAKKHGLPAACRLIFNANEFVFVD